MIETNTQRLSRQRISIQRLSTGPAVPPSVFERKISILKPIIVFAIAAAFAVDGSGQTPLPEKQPDSDQASLPSFFLDASYRTPDISQKGLPNGNYCAPCAVANLLGQFHHRGLLALPSEFVSETDARGGGGVSRSDGRQLALRLGDDDHMQTKTKKGTNRYRLVNGLGRFVRQCCTKDLRVGYVGIRDYDKKQLDADLREHVDAVSSVPTLERLKSKLARGEGVIILFGSYKPNADRSGRLERLGGHYVIAVGYGANPAGNLDARSVILHDSNDQHQGVKFVYAVPAGDRTELWSGGDLLVRSDSLIRLDQAPIRKDGRVAYLETVFSFAIADH